MQERSIESLDRHALVLALWLSFGLVAATCFHIAFGKGGWPWIAAGFAVLILGFAAHLIVHIVSGSRFTEKEVSLGLFLYAAGLLAFLLALLLYDEFQAHAMAMGLGFVATAAAVIFAIITWLGVHGAFESFDIIRRFRQR